MEKYVRPEMEIDLLEDNCDLITTSGGNACKTDFCFYGEGFDPWDCD